jgi:N-acylneuraminate cytidylyltransferase
MKTVALILARGGSKGIPRKNLISINNKPLIYYSISTCLNSNISEVWVSTDDPEIEKISKKYGANVLIRPKALSKDSSKCEEALKHFTKSVDYDVLAFVQNTSPLVTPEDINKGIQLVVSRQNDSVFSVYKEHWTGRWSLNVKPINWSPSSRPRRQDMPENYVENGAFYIITRESFNKTGLRFGEKIGVVEMPYSRSFQVDTHDDIKLINSIVRGGLDDSC